MQKNIFCKKWYLQKKCAKNFQILNCYISFEPASKMPTKCEKKFFLSLMLKKLFAKNIFCKKWFLQKNARKIFQILKCHISFEPASKMLIKCEKKFLSKVHEICVIFKKLFLQKMKNAQKMRKKLANSKNNPTIESAIKFCISRLV